MTTIFDSIPKEDLERLAKASTPDRLAIPEELRMPKTTGDLVEILQDSQVPSDTFIAFYAKDAKGEYRRINFKLMFNRGLGLLGFVEN